MSNALKTLIQWSGDDSLAAAAQGWGIFEVSRDPSTEKEVVNGRVYGHRPFELQRDDEHQVLADDAAAHAFVVAAAKAGDPLAQRAMAYLQVFSPVEYAAVVGEIPSPIRVFHALSSTEMLFSREVGAEYAVAYCYCEENLRLSELFSHREDGKIVEMLAKLPMIQGKSSVGCGDWVASTIN